jgi:hypothetical protein
MKNLCWGVLFLTSITFGQCYTSESNFKEGSFTTTHSTDIDQLTQFEVTQLEELFDVNIEFRFGMEKGTGNAEFDPTGCKAIDCYGAITLGFNVINECKNKANGNERIIAILAHEFGHAAQSKNHFPDLAGKWAELHADYLAGFYIGQRGLIEKSLLTSFASEFYSRGDTDFYDSNHHGTHQERACAFLEGYKMAIDYKFNFIQAYNAGVDYLLSLMPCNINYILKKYSKTEIVKKITLNPQIGNYFIQSTKETIYLKNLYGQVISTITPDQPCNLNGLPVGDYVIYICKKSLIGRIRKIQPIKFTVVKNKTHGLIINKVGLFAMKQYSIIFPK